MAVASEVWDFRLVSPCRPGGFGNWFREVSGDPSVTDVWFLVRYYRQPGLESWYLVNSGFDVFRADGSVHFATGTWMIGSEMIEYSPLKYRVLRKLWGLLDGV